MSVAEFTILRSTMMLLSSGQIIAISLQFCQYQEKKIQNLKFQFIQYMGFRCQYPFFNSPIIQQSSYSPQILLLANLCNISQDMSASQQAKYQQLTHICDQLKANQQQMLSKLDRLKSKQQENIDLAEKLRNLQASRQQKPPNPIIDTLNAAIQQYNTEIDVLQQSIHAEKDKQAASQVQDEAVIQSNIRQLSTIELKLKGKGETSKKKIAERANVDLQRTLQKQQLKLNESKFLNKKLEYELSSREVKKEEQPLPIDRAVVSKLRVLEAQVDAQRVRQEHQLSEKLAKLSEQYQSNNEYCRKLKPTDPAILAKLKKQLEQVLNFESQLKLELEHLQQSKQEQEARAVEAIEVAQQQQNIAKLQGIIAAQKAQKQYEQALIQQTNIEIDSLQQKLKPKSPVQDNSKLLRQICKIQTQKAQVLKLIANDQQIKGLVSPHQISQVQRQIDVEKNNFELLKNIDEDNATLMIRLTQFKEEHAKYQQPSEKLKQIKKKHSQQTQKVVLLTKQYEDSKDSLHQARKKLKSYGVTLQPDDLKLVSPGKTSSIPSQPSQPTDRPQPVVDFTDVLNMLSSNPTIPSQPTIEAPQHLESIPTETHVCDQVITPKQEPSFEQIVSSALFNNSWVKTQTFLTLVFGFSSGLLWSVVFGQ